LKKLTTQFFTTDQVDKNVEFSVREMIKKFQEGKDFCLVRVRQKLLANQVGVFVLKIINVTVYIIIINCHVKINNKEEKCIQV